MLSETMHYASISRQAAVKKKCAIALLIDKGRLGLKSVTNVRHMCIGIVRGIMCFCYLHLYFT